VRAASQSPPVVPDEVPFSDKHRVVIPVAVTLVGVTALAVLAFGLLAFLRRRRRDEEDDGQ
jgi:hypothetical protein